MESELYENPLVHRYATHKMSALWGPKRKFQTWRRLWIALAEAQAELGLAIRPEQIAQLKAHVDDVDFAAAARYEKKLRHDVMAHVHTYGDACPLARGIIHLGATSCFVTDNTDLVLVREALAQVRARLWQVIARLAEFAARHRALPCLGLTHFQPAQPTTVGRRACIWAYDLALDMAEIEHRLACLKARGVKGTVGTQASFLRLFDGDHGKVERLEARVSQKMGFTSAYPVTGQTYPRKVDAQVLDALSGIAASASKASTDIRLLQGRGELEEPIEPDQVGSSAMAYKRNPMRCERIVALARFAMNLQPSAAQTAATQWLERTLDDSAVRRLVIPQAFLAVDAILVLYENVAEGLVVNSPAIARHLLDELPFLATENILMEAVAAGGDRQELHERIRRHSREADVKLKAEGGRNDLLHRLAGDEAFSAVDVKAASDPARFVGRAPEQVDRFLAEVIEPLRAKYAGVQAEPGEIRV